MLSEPLSFLVPIAALAIEVLAPVFHYHQFGEATRMARDACFSALFTCGTVLAVFSTIRTFRREVELGTLGAFMAYLAFAAIVFAAGLVMVAGSAIARAIAVKTGYNVHVYGPCVAAGIGAMALPLVAGGLLNCLARFRFVPTAFSISFAVSAAAAVWFADLALFARLAPVVALIAIAAAVPLSAAAAFSFRFRANGAAAACGMVVACMLPAMSGYYLSDALSGGGSVSWGYVGLAALATVPAVLFFLFLGIGFIKGRDAA